MAVEEYGAPSNDVRLNTYTAEAKNRVPGSEIFATDWLIARLVNPEIRDIDRYATDVLLRLVKVVRKDSGYVRVYGKPVKADGSDEVDESDASVVDPKGFLVEGGKERGYFLSAFQRRPAGLGSLAAEAALEK